MKKILIVFVLALYSMSAGAKVNDGFILVEGGTFLMGNDYGYINERPSHSVSLNSFYICDHEVTQAEYEAIMGKNPSEYVAPDWHTASCSSKQELHDGLLGRC